MSYKSVKVKVPDLKTSYDNYSKPSVKEANIKMLKSIISNYDGIISKYNQPLALPKGIVTSFIATESGGRMVGKNAYGAIGLMQVTYPAFLEVTTNWKKHTKEDLPKFLKQNIDRLAPNKSQSAIESKLASSPELNILIGMMFIRLLLERFNGNFNRVLVAYNAGAYTKSQNVGTTPISTPIDTALLVSDKRVPSESRAYLQKVLGKDGFLELYFNNVV
jgi:soluble lytic murein transglycosylase-like protein